MNGQLKTGILIVNLGTPEQPTAHAVKKYLKEFLWDKRVVSIPRPLWWLILNGLVLVRRPPVVAKLYEKVWLSNGSPLLVYSKDLVAAISARLPSHVVAALGMRYGSPSLADAMCTLSEQNVRRLLVLPLYPQYSSTTTASVFDALTALLQQRTYLPETRWVNEYYQFPAIIEALAQSIQQQWQERPMPDKLLFSFHGLPERLLKQGDPYYLQCRITAELIAEQLALSSEQWLVSFQSRFGKETWLQPYTDKTLEKLAQDGVANVHVCCPGFPIDCLETLEEISETNRAVFLSAGGQSFAYLPALNASDLHVSAMLQLIAQHTAGWDDSNTQLSDGMTEQRCKDYYDQYLFSK